MITLMQWQIKHGVSAVAMYELEQIFGCADVSAPAGDHAAKSEAAISAAVRLEASEAGDMALRNNRGAGKMESGSFVRFGLANDTPQMNEVIKSADLIGIHKLLITPTMVGSYVGQFDSTEVKAEGWTWTGTPEEMAQLAWAQKVVSMGGRARFINCKGVW